MNKKLVIGGSILAVFIALGLTVFMSERLHAPKVADIPVANIYKLDDLKVTYQLESGTQQLYEIQVQARVKSADNTHDAVMVSGKACNNMSGSFTLLSANEKTEKSVLKTLKDGRKVVEEPVVSTMMACIAIDDLKLSDTALSAAIAAIGKSLESYQ